MSTARSGVLQGSTEGVSHLVDSLPVLIAYVDREVGRKDAQRLRQPRHRRVVARDVEVRAALSPLRRQP